MGGQTNIPCTYECHRVMGVLSKCLLVSVVANKTSSRPSFKKVLGWRKEQVPLYHWSYVGLRQALVTCSYTPSAPNHKTRAPALLLLEPKIVSTSHLQSGLSVRQHSVAHVLVGASARLRPPWLLREPIFIEALLRRK